MRLTVVEKDGLTRGTPWSTERTGRLLGERWRGRKRKTRPGREMRQIRNEVWMSGMSDKANPCVNLDLLCLAPPRDSYTGCSRDTRGAIVHIYC